MTFPRKHIRWLGLVAALVFAHGLCAQQLAEYDANDSVFESYTTIVFSQADSFIYYVAPTPSGMQYPGSHTNLGLRNYTDPDGATVAIPVYVLNVRMALEAAKSYADNHSMGIASSYSSSNRFPVYIAPVEGAQRLRSTGAWATGTKGETVYSTLASWYMTIDPGLDTQDMIMIPIHEYFHVVQNVIWSINAYPGYSSLTGRESNAHGAAVEGTAEFFTDQPIPINPIGVNLNASTTDQVNYYYDVQANHFINHYKSFFASDRDYESVFFWKALAEKAGGASPANQMAKIKEFWDGYSDRNVRGRSQFIEEVGEVAGGTGRRHDRFRQMFMQFVGASVVQTGLPHGFRDDAFTGQTSIHRPTKYSRLDRSHYSGNSLPAIAQSVARDEGEIRQRLNEIASTALNPDQQESTATVPFGFRILMIGPPDPWGPQDPNSGAWTTPNSVLVPTQVFILIKGDQPREDAWQIVGFRQVGGDSHDSRGAGVQMHKLDSFSLSSNIGIEGRPAGYTRVDDFGGNVKSIWIGVANYDEQEVAKEFYQAYAVTPVFQEWYRPEGRTTSTVKLDRCYPQREPTDKLHPGDEIRVEVNLTDSVHTGRNASIPAERRSLEAEVIGPSGTAVDMDEVKVRCTDDVHHLYQYEFKIPDDFQDFGTCTVRWTVRSRLKLGEKDKSTDESFRFEVRSDRPEVESVIVRTEREIVYHSRSNALLPLMPGAASIEVYFDQTMDRQKPAEVLMDGQPLEGEWRGTTWWRAQIEVPAGEQFAGWKGFHQLSIQATAENGAKIDADTQQAGEQPDTSRRFFVGSVPPYVKSVTMYAGGKVYDADWTGQDGVIDNYETLHAEHFEGEARRLDVKTEQALPTGQAGYLQVYIDVNQPFDTAPTLTVGGKNVPLKMGGHARAWEGKILLEEVVNENDRDRSIPVEISGRDRYGNQLDGNPGTVPLIDPAATGGSHWKHYEERRGGADSGRGGVDVWHELGAVPEMSLIIILDASGSMGDSNKLQNAKAGIMALLQNLPPRVELALVVFAGCGGVNVHGFTRNVESLKKIVTATQAGGGTPLAAAAAEARRVFLTAAHPRSRIWKCRIFSDGEESCNGDVTLNVHELEQTIAARAAPPPEEEEPEEEPEEEVEDVPCHPASWSTCRVRVRDGGLHLDQIYFDEVSFLERELPNGSCYVRLRTVSYGVIYGSIRDAGGGDVETLWRIPSSGRENVESATSRDGRAAIERIRNRARALKAAGKTRQECRQEIERVVRENSGGANP